MVMPLATPSVLIFDSGLGGLTIFRELVRVRTDARFFYAADDKMFPYGELPDRILGTRVLDVIAKLVHAYNPDLVVIACDSASTLVLAELREKFNVPFVGVVPAIGPACTTSYTKRVSVLGTRATVRHKYTHKLVQEFSNGCDVKLVGSGKLATIAEAAMREEPLDERAIAAEIASCFVDDDRGRRTDTIVLACTHYSLILDQLERAGRWPVEWIDSAPDATRQAVALLKPAAHNPEPPPPPQAIFSSGISPSPALRLALASFGIPEVNTAFGHF
jgi:glutamate racemase